MYIMRRIGHTAASNGIEKAIEITGIVQNAGVPASLWVAGPGLVPGTIVWSVALESFAQWSGYTEQMAADAAYADFASNNEGVITFAEPDIISDVVYGELEGGLEVGDYIGSIEAVVSPTREADVAAFAVEVADAFMATAGLKAVVLKNFAGDQSTITWIVRYGTAAAIDEAEAKLTASADYQAALAKGSGLFTAGNRLFARRAA